MNRPTEPCTWPTPGTNNATSPAASAGAAAVPTDGWTVSTTLTRLTDGVVLSRGRPFFPSVPGPPKYTSEMRPVIEPIGALESPRFDLSMVKVNEAVELGGIVTTPLCGMIHGTSETRTPVRVPAPEFVKVKVPVEVVPAAPARSTRFAAGAAETGAVGAAAESNVIGIWRPDGTPLPDGIDAPANAPADCAAPVIVTVWLAPGARVKLDGD